MENVKKHFEEEADEFDKTILKLIPLYSEMIDSMVNTIPFNDNHTIRVLDLGCGTGNISKVVKERFPKAQISCIDIAENMIQIAKIKLEKYEDIDFYTGDFFEFNFREKYDVVISCLALHHIKTDEDKKKFYSKIYDTLHNEGVFLNADVVLGSTEDLNQVYEEKWIEFLLKNVPHKEVEEKWLPKQAEEDFPAALTDHLKWLVETGFKSVDVVWKYYGLAVYCGTRA